MAASNHNFGAIDDDLGYASADAAHAASYDRNFSRVAP